MASTYLTRTNGTPTSRTTGTFSFWVKTSNSTGGLINNYSTDTNRAVLYFGGNYMRFYDGSTNVEYNADNAKLRDCNGWYHVVLQINTTDGTQADRVRIYINGERQSPMAGSQDYSQNENSFMFNPSSSIIIGKDTHSSGDSYFSGAISHLHYCDGQAYDASSFGETDATTGEWKIKTSPSVTYGNQGFFILKDGNSVTDQSGNSNNFTVGGGTLTKTEDCPSNVFATWNPLAHNNGNYALTNGNTSYSNADNNWSHGGLISTIGIMPSSGKYYWEHKKTYAGSHIIFGLISEDQVHRLYRDSSTDIYERINGVQLGNSGTSTLYLQEASDSGTIGAVANGSILQCAYDADNQKLWYGINGTWHNSGNPATGANETIGASEFTDGKIYFPFSQSHNSSGTASSDTNFGNGYFGTSVVSSAGTNASGIGIFEYDVPTGYTALSTKGLNE